MARVGVHQGDANLAHVAVLARDRDVACAFVPHHVHEPAGLLHLGIHSHFGGRPLVTAQFYKLLRYFSEFTDVWFPTHRELVQWFLDHKVEGVPFAQRFFS